MYRKRSCGRFFFLRFELLNFKCCLCGLVCYCSAKLSQCCESCVAPEIPCSYRELWEDSKTVEERRIGLCIFLSLTLQCVLLPWHLVSVIPSVPRGNAPGCFPAKACSSPASLLSSESHGTCSSPWSRCFLRPCHVAYCLPY